MRVFTNERLVRRNARIGQIASLAGLAVLVGGLVISYRTPEQITLTWGSLIIGFLLTQLGIFFGNRWGRRPRADELLEQAMKGLDRNYTLYNYQTPASHLLLGPAGIWVFTTRAQSGTVTFEKGRWRQRAGSAGSVLRRILGREGFGRPDIELRDDVAGIMKFFEKNLEKSEQPPVQAAMILTHPDVIIDTEEAPIPTLHAKKLKDFLRRQAKESRLSDPKVKRIQKLIEE